MISHSAVEEALHRALGCSPEQLAVTGIADPKKGERLVVVYTRELGDAGTFQDAIRSLDIPNLWKPDPRAWVSVEALPTLGTGKLDLKGIKSLAQTGCGEDTVNNP
jgi:acyl-[acyl-carrier-protein]-phospholipid O-acyltransferase/long-chain-fatty-acid--[acyl-carrier-protein] ligase